MPLKLPNTLPEIHFPKIEFLVLTMVYIGSFLLFQHDNFPFSVSLVLGIIFFPYLIQKADEPTFRLLWLLFPMTLLSFFITSSALYYFTVGLGLLFLIEINWGRINVLPFLLMIIIAPIFRYLTYIWGFPIRLKISDWVAKSLTIIGMEAKSIGNTIYLDGIPYEVEVACIGLKMTGTALVCCLLLLAYYERKIQRLLTWTSAVGWLLLGFLLTIFANFVRLLGLVIFDIPPSSGMHDLFGLLSLLVYVILPFYGMIHFSSKRYKVGHEERSIAIDNPAYLKWKRSISIFLAISFIWTGHQLKSRDEAAPAERVSVAGFPDFKQTLETYGVTRLDGDSIIVYLKPPAGPFQGAHDPRICWQGSGFKFQQIREEHWGDLTIYRARIEREDTHLDTAWWYDSGQFQTTEEWRWRWRSLFYDEQYYLINVSVFAGDDLEGAVDLVKSRVRFLTKKSAVY